MTDITDEKFETLIDRALHELPQEYIKNLDNVAITFADVPDEHQLQKGVVRGDSILLGLYEGIPLIARGAGYSGVLPDKITLFKTNLQRVTHSEASFYEQIKRTLWHEIAHHYGLDHDAIHARENGL